MDPKNQTRGSGPDRSAGRRLRPAPSNSGRLQKIDDSLDDLACEHDSPVAKPLGDQHRCPGPSSRDGEPFLVRDFLVVAVMDHERGGCEEGNDLRDIHEFDAFAHFRFNQSDECRNIAFGKAVTPTPAFDDRDNRARTANEYSPLGLQTAVQSDHGCPRAERMTNNSRERPELSANCCERLAVLQDVGFRSGRIPVSRRIDGDGAETRRDQGREKCAPVCPAAFPAVRQ